MSTIGSVSIRVVSATLLAVLLMVGPQPVRAATLSGNPDNYHRLLRTLKPGDNLALAPGEYLRGLRVHDLHGEPDRPIVVAGPAEGVRAVIAGHPRRNTVSIKDASHVTIRDLEIDGKGAFVDGVKCEGHAKFAHHITLENLYIHNLARHQQSVGISTKCPAWDWVVKRNHIEGVGTGMYFGNSDGSDPFVGGVIEANDVINTIGYNLQIKHQKARPAIAGMPMDTRFTIIRRNRFVKEEGGSTEVAARPNVLVGHFPLAGPGSDDTYAIYANLFFENPNEALFQGEGNIALYSNIFFNSHANEFPAVAIQPHNDIPRKVRVFFNTVVHPSKGIRVLRRENRFMDDQLLVGNAVFAETPLEGGTRRDNFTASFSESLDHLRAPAADLGGFSAAPRKERLRADRVVSRLVGYPEAALDFAGRPRDEGSFGAYTSSVTSHAY